ncbi:MAG: hypothetical protein IT462_00960 [Planctomycetes bacterium]|nr:hypothetical protein [Planctomycetota bacterium]
MLLKRVLLLSAIVMAGVAITGRASADPAPQPVPERPKIEEVSAEELAAFVKEESAKPFFKAAKALSPARLAPEIEKWKSLHGVEFTLITNNYIDRLFNYGEGDNEGPRYWVQNDDNGFGLRARLQLCFSRVSEPLDQIHVRTIDVKKLAEFSFDYVHTIRVEHACARVLPAFSAVNTTLTEIVSKLATECGADFAVRSDVADTIKLTLKLKNRTITSCLMEAAEAAGWLVELPTMKLKETSWSQHRTEVEYQPVYSDIDMDRIAEIFENRDWINLTERPEPRIETELDALGSMVRASANFVKSRNRIAVFPKPSNVVVMEKKDD